MEIQKIYRYIKGTVVRKDELFIMNKLRKDNRVILLTGLEEMAIPFAILSLELG